MRLFACGIERPLGEAEDLHRAAQQTVSVAVPTSRAMPPTTASASATSGDTVRRRRAGTPTPAPERTGSNGRTTTAGTRPCCVLYEGTLYDASRWLPHHPGGDAMLQYDAGEYPGLDATLVVNALHGPAAIERLKRLPRVEESDPRFLATVDARKRAQAAVASMHLEAAGADQLRESTVVGTANNASDDTSIAKLAAVSTVRTARFKQLRAEVEAAGLMEPSFAWVAYKCVTTLSLAGAAWFALDMHVRDIDGAGNGEFGAAMMDWRVWASAVLLGLFWQQSGWLAHDFCHHTTFRERRWNKWIGGYFFGGVCQGLSCLWWNDRHNTHHSICNVAKCDPDIDNVPLFAWHPDDYLGTPKGSVVRRMMRYQQYYFLPFLPLLRAIWMVQSARCVADLHNHPNSYYRRQQAAEAPLLASHYVLTWVLYTGRIASPGAAVAHWLVGTLLGGFLIAFTVFLNHYSSPKFRHDEVARDFAALQLLTTRDITPSVFVDWLMGGLNYQVEHHLFPTMPRHNLSTVAPRVKAWCEANGLPYQCTGIGEAVGDVLQFLESTVKTAQRWEREREGNSVT